jgi:anti-anti-sigma regulatory factor
MLRFSYRHSDEREEWNLCGQLSGPCVDELRSIWRRIREQNRPTHVVIDLREVTFIDEAGEQLLAEMKSAGADFVVTGVEHKHLIANLKGLATGAIRLRLEHLGGNR